MKRPPLVPRPLNVKMSFGGRPGGKHVRGAVLTARLLPLPEEKGGLPRFLIKL